ncbi:MAG: hypothetical protein ACOCV1_04300 [Bacillota bacterium]
MSRLQEEIFAQTKSLIGQINLIRIFFYTLISALMIIIVLSIFGILTVQLALIIVGISMLYSFLRDYSITKYSAKQMEKYYNYALEKYDDIDLYIPLLEKTYQGYFLKRSALIIENKQLYLEAFRQKRSSNQKQVSITVKYGTKFIIDMQKVDKNNKSVTFDSTFSTEYYRFSIVYNEKALELINEAKRGGM